ncbi:hypothetical protein Tco_0635266 [Tanacetum coccineum]
MAFRNFVYAKDEEDFSFLPKEPSPGFGTSSPSASVNIKPLRADDEPVLQPAECKTRGGSSRSPVKKKLAFGSSNSRATRAKTSTLKDDVPFLIVSDDDKGKLLSFELFSIVFAASEVHPVFALFLGLSDVPELKDATAVVDNAVNRRSRELLEVIKKLKGECDANLSTLESHIASLEAEKARLKAVEVSLRKEVDDVKQDRMEVVLKVVPYVAMELIHIDDLGSLVGRLVSFAIFYWRCKTFEQVAATKEPFDLSMVKGYHHSYKKEHDQAGNDLDIATFPWLSEFVVDPSAPVEVLLSKKPPSLQRPAPSKTQAHVASSQKATPLFVLASNSISLPADASIVKP